MGINIKYRTAQTEIMDDFSLEGTELRTTLDQLSLINRFLGGNSTTLNGVKKLLAKTGTVQTIMVIDIGCGNGDMLRILSDYGFQNNIDFKMVGIDANSFTIDYARKLSGDYPNISYRCADVFEENFETASFDIVLCTLTLHHFNDEKIVHFMRVLSRLARVGVVINDLQRSKIAYRLFQTICFLFRLNKMTKDDGLISILRGFKKCELERLAKQLHLKNYSLHWKWAFRYQWIISNI
ncbi:methyltransferase domain-containing protein [Sphingobacterium thalpophilum]|uniref:methyltransferase domain-containing protein n=2 Tax=Sphingobacterium thalpophilum TaxID=259 RepID=UPI002D79E954|nr:methyltransferase domain-containing protein [Sphingobacterium thalpophilum]